MELIRSFERAHSFKKMDEAIRVSEEAAETLGAIAAKLGADEKTNPFDDKLKKEELAMVLAALESMAGLAKKTPEEQNNVLKDLDIEGENKMLAVMDDLSISDGKAWDALVNFAKTHFKALGDKYVTRLGEFETKTEETADSRKKFMELIGRFRAYFEKMHNQLKASKAEKQMPKKEEEPKETAKEAPAA